MEHQSLLLFDFEAFLEEFGDFFNDLDKECTTINKLRTLRLGSCLAYVHASEFKQLTCDISWDEATFMSQFWFGHCGNVKDFMLTMLDPITLS